MTARTESLPRTPCGHRLAGGVAAAVLLVIALIDNGQKSIWTDEAFSLNTADRPMLGVLHQALWLELQGPTYFLLLHIWTLVSTSLPWARLLSSVSAALALYLVVARFRIRDRVVATSAGLLAVPYLLWAASEARPYALGVLLSAVLTVCWLDFEEAEASPPAGVVGYAGVAVLAISVHYFAGFLFAGQIVAGLFSSRRMRFVVAAAIVATSLLVWLPVLKEQVLLHPTFVAPVRATSEGWRGLVENAEWSAKYVVRALIPAPAIDRGVVVALLCIPLGACVLRWKSAVGVGVRAGLLRAAIMLGVPCVMLALLRISGDWQVVERYFGFLIPALVLFAARLLDPLMERGARPVSRPLLLCFAAGAIALMASALRHRTEAPEDWKAVARYIELHEGDNESLLVFDSDGVLALSHEYRGTNPVRGVPGPPALHSYDPAFRRVGSTKQLEAILNDAGGGCDPVWLIQRAVVLGDRRRAYGEPIVAGYWAEHRRIVDSISAAGLSVSRSIPLTQAGCPSGKH